MKRMISVLLVVILCVSVIPPVSASSAGAPQVVPVVGVISNTSFKSAWDSAFSRGWTSYLPAIGDVATGVKSNYGWLVLDRAVSSVGYGGFTSYVDLTKACASVNAYFSNSGAGIWMGIDKWASGLSALSFQMMISGWFSKLHFEVQEHSEYGYLIVEVKTGLVLCNSSGAFPYFKEIVAVGDGHMSDGSDSSTPIEPLGGKWVRIDKISKVYNLINEATMDDLTVALVRSNQKPNLVTHGKDYQILQRANVMDAGMPLIYCDRQNRPYALRISDSSYAVNNSQDYYTKPSSSTQNNTTPSPPTQNNTTIYDEGDTENNITFVYNEGDTENNILIDVDYNTSWFPDGTLNYIDKLFYDESTKTYYVDAHKEYDIETNTYITNNYSYTYHINYTSITYIGASEEYNKVYELYYQLPDGRNSADLTAEELKALNVSVDVVPYVRSTDNIALRSLYHFDGNVNDSSYWNYATSFDWKKGASITYLESNAFNGCLYLDETEHEFELTAPSGIGSQDFTLQWRMYNSATIAPVSDSWVSIGSDQLFTFSGSYITFNGIQYAVPVGNWYEVALIRQSGTLRLYLNGIQVGSKTDKSILDKKLLFHFGNQQQTYKQLDELRLLNFALAENGSAYTPTAVPYDTNLALVLPDSMIPVADEYWSLKTDGNLLFRFDFTEPVELNSWVKDWSTSSGSVSDVSPNYFGGASVSRDRLNYHSNNLLIAHSGSFLTITNTGSVTDCVDIPLFRISSKNSLTQYLSNYTFDPNKSYSCSILLADGSLRSFSFSVGRYSESAGYLGSVSLGNSCSLCVYRTSYKEYNYCWFGVRIPSGKSVDFVYWELKEGDPNTGHEFVTSIAPVNADFKTPTLAVRTDLEITGHQIGGVRPSLPKKGLVWALVEDGRITSLQIYNGQAWEVVDGRIWTGSRWVPYYAYDVLLLKDLYDVIEGDPSQEYIYTEEGFWAWFQRAWNQLMTKLDAILSAMGGGSGDSGSGSSGGSFFNKIGEAFSDGLAALTKGVFDLISAVLEKILGLVEELLSFLFGFLSDALVSAVRGFFSLFSATDGPLFGFFQQEGEEGDAIIGLPPDVAAVFAFFSGAVMCLPVELRSLLIFGVAAMFLFSIFKMVSRH